MLRRAKHRTRAESSAEWTGKEDSCLKCGMTVRDFKTHVRQEAWNLSAVLVKVLSKAKPCENRPGADKPRKCKCSMS